MNRTQRRRVITDIACWKVESVEVGSNEGYTDRELEEFVTRLTEMTDDDLTDFWLGTVGEWVASRHDVPERPIIDSFERVVDNRRDWGYIYPVSDQYVMEIQ